MDKIRTFSFIGSGRLTYLLLAGLKRQSALPHKILVSDPDAKHLQKVVKIMPDRILPVKNNLEATDADLIFLAVHPQVVKEVGAEIQSALKPEAIVISFIPTVTVLRLSNLLNGFNRIVRMIPNAPSIIGKGYNPVCYSGVLSADDRVLLKQLFMHWGESPEVPEKNLEAYAMITGMGPTYFWFQLDELCKLAQSFGLTEKEAKEGLSKMITGTAETFTESGLNYEELRDLVPSKPLKDAEEKIRNIYQTKLDPLYEHMKNLKRLDKD